MAEDLDMLEREIEELMEDNEVESVAEDEITEINDENKDITEAIDIKEEDEGPAMPFLKNVLALTNSELVEIIRGFCNEPKEQIMGAEMRFIDDLRHSKPDKVDLIEFVKKLKGINNFAKHKVTLKRNAEERAKLEMSTAEVWTLTASKIKKNVTQIFEKYGKVLKIFYVGEHHPLDKVEIAMDSAVACQKAIKALNARPGIRNDVAQSAFHISKEMKESVLKNWSFQQKWSELDSMLDGVMTFRSVWKKNEHFEQLIAEAQQNGEMTFDMKKVVGKIMEAMFVYVNDEHLEHEAWSNDAEFTEMIKRKSTINKVMFTLQGKIINYTGEIVQDIHEIVQARYAKNEDISEKAVFKSLFYNAPQVNLLIKFRLEYGLPDVSLCWLLLQNLPLTLTEEELRNHIKEHCILEKVIMLNRGKEGAKSSSAVIKVLGIKKGLYNVSKFLRSTPFPGASSPTKFMRYTGKLASKDHPFNKEDSLNTRETQKRRYEKAIAVQSSEVKDQSKEVKKGKVTKNVVPLMKNVFSKPANQKNQGPGVYKNKPGQKFQQKSPGFSGQRGGSSYRGKMNRGGLMGNQMNRGSLMQNQMNRGGQMQNQMNRGGFMQNQMNAGGQMQNQMNRGSLMQNQMNRGGYMQNQMDAQRQPLLNNPPQMAQDGENTTVLMEYLPRGTTVSQVFTTLGNLGQIKGVEMNSSGEASIIRLATAAQARRVIAEYNGRTMPGCNNPLEVNFYNGNARPQASGDHHRGQNQMSEVLRRKMEDLQRQQQELQEMMDQQLPSYGRNSAPSGGNFNNYSQNSWNNSSGNQYNDFY